MYLMLFLPKRIQPLVRNKSIPATFKPAGINIGSILIDGSISACPNIDKTFSQGNSYKDDFYNI